MGWGGGGGCGRVAGGGSVFKKIFFGSLRPQFGLEIRGRGAGPLGPALDSALNVARTPQRSALNNVETILLPFQHHDDRYACLC